LSTEDRSAVGTQSGTPSQWQITWTRSFARRPTDSYGLVLALIILTYVAVSFDMRGPWWTVGIFVLQGLTLYFALRTSRARHFWVVLAASYLVAGTILAAVSVLLREPQSYTDALRVVGGIVLLVTPVAIVRRISQHPVVTAQTLLGAVCVYVLLGYCFASVFNFMGLISQTPFFAGVPQATGSSYLFFSFSTLTTVGYGNLVPAGNLGQTAAMMEALMGQIFLVLIVARLVSLWGQELPRSVAQRAQSPAPPSSSAPQAAEERGADDRRGARAPWDNSAHMD
jgi:hypothetical protein